MQNDCSSVFLSVQYQCHLFLLNEFVGFEFFHIDTSFVHYMIKEKWLIFAHINGCSTFLEQQTAAVGGGAPCGCLQTDLLEICQRERPVMG